MNRSPTVSFVIPFYDAASTLVRAVDCALNQEGGIEPQVIVVDDASQEDARAALASRLQDDRLLYIRLDKNQGPANARNIGLQNATGQWVQFLDADDEISRQKCIVQMAEAGTAEMVTCNWVDHYISMGLRVKRRCRLPPGTASVDEFVESNPFVIHVPLVRRAFLDRVGPFNTGVYHEDWEYWIRAAALAPQTRHVAAYLCTYHRRDGSRSADVINSLLQEIDCLDCVAHLELPDVPGLEEKIARARRARNVRLAAEYLASGNLAGAKSALGEIDGALGLRERASILQARIPYLNKVGRHLPGPLRLLRSWVG